MSKVLLGLALWFPLSAALLWPVLSSSQARLQGTYTCKGLQGGESYTMYLVVQELGKTYEFRWSPSERDPAVLAGLGVLHGDQLAVALASPNGGIGAALYTVKPGRLEGIWTRGDGNLESETCTSGRTA